ncbi:MAG: HNH endonuclease [Planctomycetota bacterium]
MSPAENNEKWFKALANLRVDRKGHDYAPHKPLLLLVVLELAEKGGLSEPDLPLTGELVFRFLAFWTVVAPRRTQRPEITLPFFHLRAEGVWTPLDETGTPTLERRRATAVRLDEGFLAALRDTAFREQLRRILIAKYFTSPGERAALYDLVGLPVPPDDIVQADAKLYKEDQERGREARFRLTVVPAYDYTCALTGYRLVTVTSGSIVDAAHIHQFADSRNNDPRNGMALCKNAHWLFDQGLWSLDDDYRIIVATSRFHEAGPEAILLARRAGTRVHLPGDRRYWPDTRYVAWHRKNKF